MASTASVVIGDAVIMGASQSQSKARLGSALDSSIQGLVISPDVDAVVYNTDMVRHWPNRCITLSYLHYATAMHDCVAVLLRMQS